MRGLGLMVRGAGERLWQPVDLLLLELGLQLSDTGLELRVEIVGILQILSDKLKGYVTYVTKIKAAQLNMVMKWFYKANT